MEGEDVTKRESRIGDIGEDQVSTDRVIIEQRVKVNQKARILELKQRNHKDDRSDNLYAISIKEDTAYLCHELHSASTKEDLYDVSR
ncbi:hypothetical protein Tco_0741573 [Tanacetum coccineum]